MKNNIVLIGFMGSGKSTVGKQLSKLLGYTFVDTDLYIEQKENMTVSEIFAKHGEAYFRTLETEVAEVLSHKERLVIATGGGMILNKKNAQTLRSNALSVWLKVSPETVLERLKNDTSRPLLNHPNKTKAIEELLLQRNAMYNAACDVNVNADDTLENVTQSILSICGKM